MVARFNITKKECDLLLDMILQFIRVVQYVVYKITGLFLLMMAMFYSCGTREIALDCCSPYTMWFTGYIGQDPI